MREAEIIWQSGQAFNTQFEDIYFSRENGIAETEHVFLAQNNLPSRWRDKTRFVIAETGFGTGLNFFTTVSEWLKTSHQNACLHYFSVEKFPLKQSDLKQALSAWPDLQDLVSAFTPHYPPAVAGFHHIPLFNHRVVLTLLFGDAESMLPKMRGPVDAWYLDGFAPGKNPQMWTDTVFQNIAQLSKKGSTFSTFTAAGQVRRALATAGFSVAKVAGYGKKREMLRGMLKENPRAKPSEHPWFEYTPRVNKNKHAVVVGAGLAGITTAWALAKRGWQIDLIDQRSAIAQAGSGNPLGILMPRISLGENAEAAFYAAAYLKAIRECCALQKKYPDLLWKQDGVLQVATSERIKKQMRKLNCCDDFARVLSAAQTNEMSGLTINKDAFYFPLAGILSPQNLCKYLIDDAGGCIQTRFNTAIHRLAQQDGQWVLYDREEKIIARSEKVILANAVQVSKFEQTQWLKLSAARGQISMAAATSKSKKIRRAICFEGYVLPEINGEHLIGASFIRGDQDTTIREAEHRNNIDQLRHLFPDGFGFETKNLKGHAALRATTPDRMPLVGPIADLDFFKTHYHDLHHGRIDRDYPKARDLKGLYVNTGHGARGICSSFLCAELIVGQICSEPLSVSEAVRHALHPSRFLIRDLKSGEIKGV